MFSLFGSIRIMLTALIYAFIRTTLLNCWKICLLETPYFSSRDANTSLYRRAVAEGKRPPRRSCPTLRVQFLVQLPVLFMAKLDRRGTNEYL